MPQKKLSVVQTSNGDAHIRKQLRPNVDMEDVIVKKHRGNSVEYHFEKRPVEGSSKDREYEEAGLDRALRSRRAEMEELVRREEASARVEKAKAKQMEAKNDQWDQKERRRSHQSVPRELPAYAAPPRYDNPPPAYTRSQRPAAREHMDDHDRAPPRHAPEPRARNAGLEDGYPRRDAPASRSPPRDDYAHDYHRPAPARYDPSPRAQDRGFDNESLRRGAPAPQRPARDDYDQPPPPRHAPSRGGRENEYAGSYQREAPARARVPPRAPEPPRYREDPYARQREPRRADFEDGPPYY